MLQEWILMCNRQLCTTRNRNWSATNLRLKFPFVSRISWLWLLPEFLWLRRRRMRIHGHYSGNYPINIAGHDLYHNHHATLFHNRKGCRLKPYREAFYHKREPKLSRNRKSLEYRCTAFWDCYWRHCSGLRYWNFDFCAGGRVHIPSTQASW